ncbi:MAG: hypothetical protein ACK4HF_17400 [Paracoccaceae bacterium]
MSLKPEAELVEVRAQLLRLQQREIQLQKELQAALRTPPERPGWPIRRQTGQALH